MKKLLGKTDIEDALKRLDKLTNEEMRMVTAQVLKGTQDVNDRVRVVDDRVAGVDDRVVGVDDRVAGVDNRVASVDDRVAGVDDRVAGVDDRVAHVDETLAIVDDNVKAGAQPSSTSHQQNILNSDVPRGKRDEGTHTTSRRQHGSSETLVIFFLR